MRMKAEGATSRQKILAYGTKAGYQIWEGQGGLNTYLGGNI